jgi:tetraacyldisaccharide 4'-kinase
VRARRGWAWPLVPVYAAGLAVKDGLRAAGVLQARRLGWPVVSVGSLSAGGAGKTPVVIALAQLLQARGWGVDVLSRGYGRSGGDKRLKEFVAQVVPELDDAAAHFGDEPTMMAQRLGVPVWVSANRYLAGRTAEDFAAEDALHLAGETTVAQNAPEPVRRVHLLDDGFQHRGLARALDVVLVTEEDLEDALLPAGNRRERLHALKRADVVVLREEEREPVEVRVREFMRPDSLIWITRRQISFPEIAPIFNSEIPTYGHVIFSAIARPENFLQMLSEVEINALEVVTFADHHAYTEGDIDRLLDAFESSVGNGFITTEKDAVKLRAEMRARLEAVGPLVVARLDAVFVDEAAVVRDLEARIG